MQGLYTNNLLKYTLIRVNLKIAKNVPVVNPNPDQYSGLFLLFKNR